MKKGLERAPKQARCSLPSRDDDERGSREDSDDEAIDLDDETAFAQDDWTEVLRLQTAYIIFYEAEKRWEMPERPADYLKQSEEKIKAGIVSSRKAFTRRHWIQVERDWRSFCKDNFNGE